MKQILKALLFIIPFLSCEKEVIVGSGPIGTEQRSVANFTKIEVRGRTAVTVMYGTNFKVEVKAYQNLLPVLETKLMGDALQIGYKSDVSVTNDKSEVIVTMPFLTRFSTTGDSEIKILSGAANDFEGYITGSSTLNAFGYVAKNAKINIEGNGFASISVVDRLKVNITGSGTVYYRGTPIVTSIITGTGKVEKR
jgi:Putative auto-transporter adhesin, head GIN domain